MSKAGPIILVEDDADDQELVMEAIAELGFPNKVNCFPNGELVLDYLLSTDDSPFIIFCDINLPILDGLTLKQRIDGTPMLREKSIPFVFVTTTSDPNTVREAYKMTVQGFFVKPNSYRELKSLVNLMLEYWSVCRHPNS